ncbi:MAG: hypothetical protein WAK60_07545 [Sedimentisphaerales bacterium]
MTGFAACYGGAKTQEIFLKRNQMNSKKRQLKHDNAGGMPAVYGAGYSRWVPKNRKSKDGQDRLNGNVTNGLPGDTNQQGNFNHLQRQNGAFRLTSSSPALNQRKTPFNGFERIFCQN